MRASTAKKSMDGYCIKEFICKSQQHGLQIYFKLVSPMLQGRSRSSKPFSKWMNYLFRWLSGWSKCWFFGSPRGPFCWFCCWFVCWFACWFCCQIDWRRSQKYHRGLTWNSTNYRRGAAHYLGRRWKNVTWKLNRHWLRPKWVIHFLETHSIHGRICLKKTINASKINNPRLGKHGTPN